jgi:predicted methyltransferase
MNKLFSVIVIACCFASAVFADDGGVWDEIVQGEHRSQKASSRDVYRHPVQTLKFFEVDPQHTVVEIWPGAGGWYSEILAPLLREQGVLYAAHFSADSPVAFFRNALLKYQEKLAAHPQVYDRVVMTSFQPPEQLGIAPDASADRVLTFRNVHNWMKRGAEQEAFAAFYKALKPGGVLGVVEHRAKPGTELEHMIGSGYVTEAYVKTLAVEAGFVFIAASEINANIADSTDHPKGVWTLPPALRLGEEQREKYLAIGESDRMTLKFQKPAND